ncbi:MAG: AI-2E family transporter [Ignavibacteria bacterium]|jgi:predicted PurR-regulated permease PerM
MKFANSKIEIFIFLIIVFYLLNILSSLLIPLAFAYLAASLFQPVINYLLNKKIPKWLIYPLVIIFSLSFIFLVVLVFSSSISEFVQQQSYFEERLATKFIPFIDSLNSFMLNYFGTELKLNEALGEILKSDFLTSAVGSFINAIGDFTSSFIIFAFYYIVFLITMNGYKEYLNYVKGEKNDKVVIENYEKIQTSIFTYVKVKIIVSIFTAVLVYVVLIIFGVKFAFLWGLLTFLLNFIPIVGSLIAVILPTLMGVIQFDSFSTIVILFILLETSQVIVGNVVEPIMMGNSLRLNTITTMFGLVFWGFIWGIPGMLLSMPLVVIFKILFEQSTDLAFLGRILGTPEPTK